MRISKRCFDIIAAAIGIVLLSPLFVFVALLIKTSSPGPIFFKQERIGHQGGPFLIWKFRTMVKDAESLGGALTIGSDLRITWMGDWLRKTKFDELPQLFNVLTGEMSLVGPRPEVEHYVKLYTEEQRKVLDLTPGITDPASIHFKRESQLLGEATQPEHTYINSVMPEKIRLNLEYAKQANFWSDLGVILRTTVAIFRG
ncbi:MAG: sugar transferase [Gammaproteobacteria bacterium]